MSCECNNALVLGVIGENKRVCTLDTTMPASATVMAVDNPVSVGVYEFKCAFRAPGGISDLLELRLTERVLDAADIKRPKLRAIFFKTLPVTPVVSVQYESDMTKYLDMALVMSGQAVHTTPNNGYRRVNSLNNQAHVQINSTVKADPESTSIWMVLLADDVFTPVTGTVYEAELVVRHHY